MEKSDSETLKNKGAPKRKLNISEYPEFMAKRFADFRSYRNTTLQKWHDKTKLSGKISKVSVCVIAPQREPELWKLCPKMAS